MRLIVAPRRHVARPKFRTLEEFMMAIRGWCPISLELVVFGLALLLITGCSHRVISVKDVDAMIRSQIPIGSDKQKVKKFIDELQVDSLRIGRDEFHKADPYSLGNFDLEKTDRLGDRIYEFIGAVIYNSRSDGVFTFDNIAICFYIDKQGTLIDYSLKESGSE